MRNILEKVQMRLGALVLGIPLYIIGWKRRVIRENAARLGLAYSQVFRARFCFHVALDFLRLIRCIYEPGLRIRPRDTAKLKILKSTASLFLTGHFHHWERMGAWLTSQGVPLLSAARPLAQGWAQNWLHGIRTRMGMKVIYRDIPRGALKHLIQDGCFALLWDQRVIRSEIHAPFFGIPLPVDPLPAFLLRHQSTPVFFGCLLPNGQLRLLQLAAASPGAPLPSLAPNRLARRYHRVLEFLIRRHPTWWYGFAHRRFRDASAPVAGSGVSRETLVPSGVMVSRETKLSS